MEAEDRVFPHKPTAEEFDCPVQVGDFVTNNKIDVHWSALALNNRDVPIFVQKDILEMDCFFTDPPVRVLDGDAVFVQKQSFPVNIMTIKKCFVTTQF